MEYISDIHQTSQRHKTPLNEYTINPKQIPHPNNNDEIYLNLEKNPIYEININTLPPHSTSHYVVKETKISSCRFIRSKLNYIPNSQLLLNESNLLFGIFRYKNIIFILIINIELLIILVINKLLFVIYVILKMILIWVNLE